MISFTFMLYFWKTHIYAEKVQLSDCLFRDSFIGLRLTLYSIYRRPLYIEVYVLCLMFFTLYIIHIVFYPIFYSRFTPGPISLPYIV